MESINRKKYIVVTPFFPSPLRWQGAYVLDQVKAIKRHSNFDVIVFKTHTLGDREADYIIDDIEVHCIHPLFMPSYILNGLTGGVIGKLFVKKLKQLHINLDEIAYIHCHTTNHAAFGLKVKKFNQNTKVILQFHDPDPLTLRNGKWAQKGWNLYYRAIKGVKTLNKVDLLLCISEHVKDAVLAFPQTRAHEVFEPAILISRRLESVPKVEPKAIYILNNGVDLRMFNQHRVARNSEIFRIGCIANFNDWKNHIMLVRAFHILIEKGLTNLRLSLLGSGETQHLIKKYVHDHQLTPYVEWPKEVNHDQLPSYYNTLDLFVLPSRFEGFGCVYTEAYACGVPFICTENQGASECVVQEEKDMWLVRDQDSQHLANLIERQYTERSKQHLCKDIDIDILIPRYLEFLNNI